MTVPNPATVDVKFAVVTSPVPVAPKAVEKVDKVEYKERVLR